MLSSSAVSALQEYQAQHSPDVNPTASTLPSTPPADFLKGPAQDAKVTRIDFSKTLLTHYANCYAVVLDNILSPQECVALLHYAEASAPKKWERALVNVGMGEQKLMEQHRKCARIIWDEQSLVDRIWERCRPLIPELEHIDSTTWPALFGRFSVVREGKLRMTRVNNRMRILKYTGGEYFKPHQDGCYVTDDGRETSQFTLHLYLNDADHQENDEKLRGGATTFWDGYLNKKTRVDVQPKMGSVLIFQHKNLLHSGDDVVSGTKYTMRTDIMYTRDEA